jgi:hypothetical protein
MKILTLIFILVFSLSVFGQGDINTCKSSDSPIIQRVRLDTPLALIKRDLKLDFGKVKRTIAGDTYDFTNPNKQMKRLFLTFYKNNLLSIMAIYSDEIQWDSLVEFRRKINDNLNVSGVWEDRNQYGLIKSKLDCTNFTLNVTKDISGYSLHSLSKIVALRLLKDSKQEAKKKTALQQKKKGVFKP